MRRIRIRLGRAEATATLLDTPTAEAIWQALPLRFHASRWGDEWYGRIPIEVDEEPSAHEAVAVGDLAYWPPGNAFCLFFGPTPASVGNEPRAASPVNVFGHVEGDAHLFDTVEQSATVEVQAA